MIYFRQHGDFSKTEDFLRRLKQNHYMDVLEKYAKEGVRALAEATPKDTGLTAASWGYRIERREHSVTVIWTNSNVQKGVNIAIILQYGHGTRNGGYVKGRDYINPALQPIFDKMAKAAWKELINS